MPVPKIAVFISHSKEDLTLAQSLAFLFTKAFELPPEKSIRCSSVDGYRLGCGDPIDETLRTEVQQAEAFVALITPASIRSQYVLFELGARWGCGRRIRPLLAGGIVTDGVRPPLSNLACLNADCESHVMQLTADLAGELSVQCVSPQMLESGIQKVTNLAQPKHLNSSAVRDICRSWARDDDKKKHGDLHLVPALFESEDEVLAFIGTKNYKTVGGIAITQTWLAWKNPTDPKIFRRTWRDLAQTEIVASKIDERILIGSELVIDLCQSSYAAKAVAELLREIARLAAK